MLHAHQGVTDKENATACGMHTRSIQEIRKHFVEQGIELTLNGIPKKPRSKKLGVADEAGLSLWPAKQSRTVTATGRFGFSKTNFCLLRTLLWKASLTRRFERRLKNEFKPWQRKEWCIPPKASAEFVAHMEDILAVYQRPHDPSRPLVCMDECPKQLIGETRAPLPPAPGFPRRYDTEYVRNWTCNQLEIRYTPKNGSWLNMAEIELSVLNHHGLSERIANIEKMRTEIDAWQNKRNEQKRKIKRAFTIEDARDKMKNTYPQLQD